MKEIFVTDRTTDRRMDRQTHKGKTVYPSLLLSRGIKMYWYVNTLLRSNNDPATADNKYMYR